MTTATVHKEPLQRLTELIRDIRVAMLTTATEAGDLRSRPMVPCHTDPEGGLWFFTHAGDPKVEEARRHPHVNVCFADPGGNRYVSVSGTAALVRDRVMIRELWDDSARAWLPSGPDDPDLALLRVDVERAEYWDGPDGVTFEDVKVDVRTEDR
jgi:general stress protein 26